MNKKTRTTRNLMREPKKNAAQKSSNKNTFRTSYTTSGYNTATKKKQEQKMPAMKEQKRKTLKIQLHLSKAASRT